MASPTHSPPPIMTIRSDHVTAELEVTSPIDDPHAPVTQFAEQFEVTQPLARVRGRATRPADPARTALTQQGLAGASPP